MTRHKIWMHDMHAARATAPLGPDSGRSEAESSVPESARIPIHVPTSSKLDTEAYSALYLDIDAKTPYGY